MHAAAWWLQVTVLLPLLVLLWAVLASPVIGMTWWVIRHLRRQGRRSFVHALALSIGFTALAAPIPTPIITVLLPNAVFLFAGYFPELDGHPDNQAQMMTWAHGAWAITSLITLPLFAWLLRKPLPPPPA